LAYLIARVYGYKVRLFLAYLIARVYGYKVRLFLAYLIARVYGYKVRLFLAYLVARVYDYKVRLFLTYLIATGETRVQSLVGHLLQVLKYLRINCYLYIDINKWLDFRVLSDKDVKIIGIPRIPYISTGQ
jgi:hypothetical protein